METKCTILQLSVISVQCQEEPPHMTHPSLTLGWLLTSGANVYAHLKSTPYHRKCLTSFSSTHPNSLLTPFLTGQMERKQRLSHFFSYQFFVCK